MSGRYVIEVADHEWQLKAACLDMDPDLFFPTRGESTTEAKEACASCPVREECLEYALRNNIDHGWWGGLSERQRRKLRRARRAA